MTDKARELSKQLQELANQIVTDTDKLDQFSKKWNNGFHDYSFGNTILIWFQNPDATLCAGYHDWLAKHKRYVKKGEHGISILAPMFIKRAEENDAGEVEEREVRFFRAVTTFDVSQTDGEPLELGQSDNQRGQGKLALNKRIGERKMDYTKGDWKVEENSLLRTRPYMIRAGNQVIANVDSEANARLISQAPRMYEALKQIRQDINWMLNNHKFLNPSSFEYLDKALFLSEVEG